MAYDPSQQPISPQPQPPYTPDQVAGFLQQYGYAPSSSQLQQADPRHQYYQYRDAILKATEAVKAGRVPKQQISGVKQAVNDLAQKMADIESSGSSFSDAVSNMATGATSVLGEAALLPQRIGQAFAGVGAELATKYGPKLPGVQLSPELMGQQAQQAYAQQQQKAAEEAYLKEIEPVTQLINRYQPQLEKAQREGNTALADNLRKDMDEEMARLPASATYAAARGRATYAIPTPQQFSEDLQRLQQRASPQSQESFFAGTLPSAAGSLLGGMAAGPAAALPLLSASAASSGMEQAQREGASGLEQLGYGALTGGTALVTERFGLPGRLGKAYRGALPEETLAGAVGRGMLGEGVGEATESVVGDLGKAIYSDNASVDVGAALESAAAGAILGAGGGAISQQIQNRFGVGEASPVLQRAVERAQQRRDTIQSGFVDAAPTTPEQAATRKQALEKLKTAISNPGDTVDEQTKLNPTMLFVDEMGRELGVNVVFYERRDQAGEVVQDERTQQGAYDPDTNTVLIDVNSQDHADALFAHEFSHAYDSRSDQSLYDRIRAIDPEGLAQAEAQFAGIDPDQASDEKVRRLEAVGYYAQTNYDYIIKHLADDKFLNRVAREGDLFDWFIDTGLRLVNRVFGRNMPDPREARARKTVAGKVQGLDREDFGQGSVINRARATRMIAEELLKIPTLQRQSTALQAEGRVFMREPEAGLQPRQATGQERQIPPPPPTQQLSAPEPEPTRQIPETVEAAPKEESLEEYRDRVYRESRNRSAVLGAAKGQLTKAQKALAKWVEDANKNLAPGNRPVTEREAPQELRDAVSRFTNAVHILELEQAQDEKRMASMYKSKEALKRLGELRAEMKAHVDAQVEPLDKKSQKERDLIASRIQEQELKLAAADLETDEQRQRDYNKRLNWYKMRQGGPTVPIRASDAVRYKGGVTPADAAILSKLGLTQGFTLTDAAAALDKLAESSSEGVAKRRLEAIRSAVAKMMDTPEGKALLQQQEQGGPKRFDPTDLSAEDLATRLREISKEVPEEQQLQARLEAAAAQREYTGPETLPASAVKPEGAVEPVQEPQRKPPQGEDLGGGATQELLFSRRDPRMQPAPQADFEAANEIARSTGFLPYVNMGPQSVPLGRVRSDMNGVDETPQIGLLFSRRVGKAAGNAIVTQKGKDKKAVYDKVHGLKQRQQKGVLDGTVTVYLHTTEQLARQIAATNDIPVEAMKDGRLYLTTDPRYWMIEKNKGKLGNDMDGGVIELHVQPSVLHLLEDRGVAPDDNSKVRRKDFFVPVLEGRAFAERLGGTKLKALRKDRTVPIDSTITLSDIVAKAKSGLADYLKLDDKARKARLAQARETLFTQHNVGTLLTANEKLQKSDFEKSGLTYDGKPVETLGLGMSAAQQLSDKLKTCPNAPQCLGQCLGDFSGQNRLYGGRGKDRMTTRLAQFLKTEALVMHPEDMMIVLHDEIGRLRDGATERGSAAGVRLNVTSDFPGKLWAPLMDAYPDVYFYDYTATAQDPIRPNHHLTYSSKGLSQWVNGKDTISAESTKTPTFWDKLVDRLSNGQNVAMAFTMPAKPGMLTPFPKYILDMKTGKKFLVVNGDLYDFRRADAVPEGYDGVIIALSNKDVRSKKNWSEAFTANPEIGRMAGFFVHYQPHTGDTLVVPDQTRMRNSDLPREEFEKFLIDNGVDPRGITQDFTPPPPPYKPVKGDSKLLFSKRRLMGKDEGQGVSPTGFYSRSVKAITDNPMKKGSGAQWLNSIKKTGVSSDELAQLGLNDLASPDNANKTFTKEQVLDIAASNQRNYDEVALFEPAEQHEYVEALKSLDEIVTSHYVDKVSSINRRLYYEISQKYASEDSYGIKKLDKKLEFEDIDAFKEAWMFFLKNMLKGINPDVAKLLAPTGSSDAWKSIQNVNAASQIRYAAQSSVLQFVHQRTFTDRWNAVNARGPNVRFPDLQSPVLRAAVIGDQSGLDSGSQDFIENTRAMANRLLYKFFTAVENQYEELGIDEKIKKERSSADDITLQLQLIEKYIVNSITNLLSPLRKLDLQQPKQQSVQYQPYSFYQLWSYIPGTYSESFLTVSGQKNSLASIVDMLTGEVPAEDLVWYDGHEGYENIQNPIIRIRSSLHENGQSLRSNTFLVDEIQPPQFEGVPEVYRKHYRTIGVNYALLLASEAGADRIAWTTGHQQAHRYNMSVDRANKVIKLYDEYYTNAFKKHPLAVKHKLKYSMQWLDTEFFHTLELTPEARKDILENKIFLYSRRRGRQAARPDIDRSTETFIDKQLKRRGVLSQAVNAMLGDTGKISTDNPDEGQQIIANLSRAFVDQYGAIKNLGRRALKAGVGDPNASLEDAWTVMPRKMQALTVWVNDNFLNPLKEQMADGQISSVDDAPGRPSLSRYFQALGQPDRLAAQKTKAVNKLIEQGPLSRKQARQVAESEIAEGAENRETRIENRVAQLMSRPPTAEEAGVVAEYDSAAEREAEVYRLMNEEGLSRQQAEDQVPAQFGKAAFSEQQAARIVEEAHNGPAGNQYRKIADLVANFNAKSLQHYVTTGLISAEQAKQYRDLYGIHYVPFKDWPDRINRMHGGSAGARRRMFHEAKGRRSEVFGVIEQLIAQSLNVMAKGERNVAYQSLANTIDEINKRIPSTQAPTMRVWRVEREGVELAKEEAMRRARKNRAQDIERLTEELGDEASAIQVADQLVKDRYDRFLKTTMQMSVRRQLLDSAAGNPENSSGQPQTDPVQVYFNGELAYITTTDPILEQALHSEEMMSKGDGLAKAIRKMVQTRVMLTTRYSPSFIMRNVFRDVGLAKIALEIEYGKEFAQQALPDAVTAPKELLRVMRDAARILRADKSKLTGEDLRLRKEFDESGARAVWTQPKNLEERAQELQDALIAQSKRASKDAGYSPASMFSKLKETIDMHAESLENATRYRVFVTARQRGFSMDRAAAAAARVTTDFTQRGTQSMLMNALYLFSSVNMVSTARLFRLVTSQSTSKGQAARLTAKLGANVAAGIAGRLFAFGVINGILNYITAGDDDEGRNAWETKNEWEKRTRFMLMVPGTSTDIHFALPWGFDVPYVMGVRLVDTMFGNLGFTNYMTEMASKTAEATVLAPFGQGQGASKFIPDLGKPIYQVAANQDWQGRPLRPAMFDPDSQDPDSQQYFSNENKAAVFVAESLNKVSGGDDFTPGVLDMAPSTYRLWAEFVAGGVMRDSGRAVDAAMRLFSGDYEAEDVNQTFLIRELIGTSNTGMYTREEYEQLSAPIMDAKADIRKAEKRIESAQAAMARATTNDLYTKAANSEQEAIADYYEQLEAHKEHVPYVQWTMAYEKELEGLRKALRVADTQEQRRYYLGRIKSIQTQYILEMRRMERAR